VGRRTLKEIAIVEDVTSRSRCDQGFIRLLRLKVKHHYSDGSESTVYPCDIVELPSIDAVVVAIFWIDPDRRIQVGLRTNIRPAVYFRKDNPVKTGRNGKVYFHLLELVAGGVELSDINQGGLRRRVIHEVYEEAGFRCSDQQVIPLGGGSFSSPGIIGEKLFFFALEIDPKKKEPPPGDGHPMEEASEVRFVDLSRALLMCHSGEIEDTKTEIGLRRLAIHLGFVPELGLWADELPKGLSKRFRKMGL
jgi:ADP-ribose pyrophosphatase